MKDELSSDVFLKEDIGSVLAALKFAAQQTAGHSPNGATYVRGFLAGLRSVEIGLHIGGADATELAPDFERAFRQAADEEDA